MIKIQLLPPHITERRRVRKWVVIAILVLILETVGFAAYIWGPMDSSLSSRLESAQQRLTKANEELNASRALENEISAIKARYGSKFQWVDWVSKTDGLPQQWIDYFEMLNKYIPADVVLNGIPLPSGNTLTLSGQTSDVMAAMRWYLNMLRCEMVQPNPQLVDIQTDPNPYSWEAPDDGVNPRMRHSVTIRVELEPNCLNMYHLPEPFPGEAGAGRAARGGGRMGMGGRGTGGGRGMGRGRGMGGGRMGGGGGGRMDRRSMRGGG